MSKALRQHIEAAQSNGFTGADARETGFAQNFGNAAAAFVQQDLAMSRYLMHEPVRARSARLEELMREGSIPEEVGKSFARSYGINNSFTTYDYDGLAEYANTLEGEEYFQSDEELTDSIAELVQFTEAQRQEVYSRAGITGVAGTFSAGLVSASIDPPNILASLIIPGAGQAATLTKSMLHGAKIGAVSNLAVEVVTQPFIHSWKNEVGLQYTYSDAMTNMALSTVMGASLSGLLSGGAHLVGSKISAAQLSKARDKISTALEEDIVSLKRSRAQAVREGNTDGVEAIDEAIITVTKMKNDFDNAPESGNMDFKETDKDIGEAGLDNEQGRSPKEQQETPPVEPVSHADVENFNKKTAELFGEEVGVETKEQANLLGAQLVEGVSMRKHMKAHDEYIEKLAVAITCIGK